MGGEKTFFEKLDAQKVPKLIRFTNLSLIATFIASLSEEDGATLKDLAVQAKLEAACFCP